MGFAISIKTSLGTGTGPGVNRYFFTLISPFYGSVKTSLLSSFSYIKSARAIFKTNTDTALFICILTLILSVNCAAEDQYESTQDTKYFNSAEVASGLANKA